MAETSQLTDGRLSFDPAGDFEAFIRSAPARSAVCLLSDAEDRPIQLLCVGNLRASLIRRLGGQEQVGPTRRVDYRQVVRNVRWRRVDSPFEADWIYCEIAREVFPQTYQGMVGFRPAWFIHVNPDTEFPRYIKVTDLSRSGILIGPLEDKHAAARLIQLVEDAFDLCRYYNILVDAPRARACAYREMGKCPAPCDGSISMAQYRRLIEWSARTLIDPADATHAAVKRMAQAAAELRFETAAKIKAYSDQLGRFGKGAYRYARPLRDFQFVSVQHGPRAGTAKVFQIGPGMIEQAACLIDEPRQSSELVRTLLETAARFPTEVDSVGAERIAIVSHHLFASKASRGVFLRMEDVTAKSLAAAYRDLARRPAEEPSDAEGIVRELQSL